mgnify:CR=1 FL=1
MAIKNPRWTEKEDLHLKEHYGLRPVKEISLMLDRSEDAIKGRVKRLRKKGWSFDSVRR